MSCDVQCAVAGREDVSAVSRRGLDLLVTQRLIQRGVLDGEDGLVISQVRESGMGFLSTDNALSKLYVYFAEIALSAVVLSAVVGYLFA